MTLPVVIVGAGGHAQVLAETLVAMGLVVKGFVDSDPAKQSGAINGIPVIGGDDVLVEDDVGKVELANGIGSANSLQARRAVFERFRARKFHFVTIVHPRAVISPTVRLEEGAQIMAGAIIQSNAVIGENTIVNTGAIVDHDCKIGPHCHIAPGCTLSGNVSVGSASHIGTGATIKQGISLGARTLVGAGAAVLTNHPGDATLVGVPAKVQV